MAAGDRMVSINLPAVFREWLGTTDLAGNTDGLDPERKEMWLACVSGQRIKSGDSYYVRVQATGTTLAVLKEYADYCVDDSLDLAGGKRLNAANKVIERVHRAREQLTEV